MALFIGPFWVLLWNFYNWLVSIIKRFLWIWWALKSQIYFLNMKHWILNFYERDNANTRMTTSNKIENPPKGALEELITNLEKIPNVQHWKPKTYLMQHSTIWQFETKQICNFRQTKFETWDKIYFAIWDKIYFAIWDKYIL